MQTASVSFKMFSAKGETDEEFAGFVSEFRKLAKNPNSMIMRTGQLICVALVVIGQGVLIFPLLSASLLPLEFQSLNMVIVRLAVGSADLLETW